MNDNSQVCAGPLLSRRQLLQVGGAGWLGLNLPGVLRADEQRKLAGASARADACIVIFLNGGPSHLDMWDMKPDAPPEIRGPFKPIASSVSGVSVSEHLPGLAKLMHRCTLVRSMHHTVNNSHAAAGTCPPPSRSPDDPSAWRRRRSRRDHAP